MTAYSVINAGAMVAGQVEDISVVLSNFNAIAAIINALDNTNVAPSAAIDLTKLASSGQIGASGVTVGSNNVTLGANGAIVARSASTIGANWLLSRVSGDTVDRFIAFADGTLNWGSGAAALDTNLYRAGANQLKTDDDFYAADVFVGTNGAFAARNATTAGDDWLLSRVSGDTQDRFIAFADGTLNWGGGSSAADTNLYRSTTSTLKTDGKMFVAGDGGSLGISGLSITLNSIGPRIIKCGATDSGGGGSRMLVVDN